MPERSKGADLRSASASCVGSNPTLVTLQGGFFNGMAQWLARRTHNPKVRGSSPLPVRPQAAGRIGANYMPCVGPRLGGDVKQHSDVVQSVRIHGFHPCDPGSIPGIGKSHRRSMWHRLCHLRRISGEMTCPVSSVVERQTFNLMAVGSIPTSGIKILIKKIIYKIIYYFFLSATSKI